VRLASQSYRREAFFWSHWNADWVNFVAEVFDNSFHMEREEDAQIVALVVAMAGQVRQNFEPYTIWGRLHEAMLGKA
jgi:hypothetical protein